MSTIIPIEGGQPEELPEWQSPQTIERIVGHAKPGDIVHIVPQGEKLQYLRRNLGIDQIHGCIDDASTPEKLVIWSTYYVANADAFGEDEQRAYSPSDIRLIELDKAETYIHRATQGQFAYGMEAQTQCQNKLFVVKVDSFFDGLVSGKTSDGIRITGGRSFFSPYNG